MQSVFRGSVGLGLFLTVLAGMGCSTDSKTETAADVHSTPDTITIPDTIVADTAPVPDTVLSDAVAPDVTLVTDTMEPDVSDSTTTPDTNEPDIATTPDTNEPDSATTPDTLTPDVIAPSACGNGTMDGVEGCDDGNVIDGDGCSSTCAIEPQCTEGCTDTSECAADELCVGKPKTVMGATGQCAPKGSPSGTGQSCGASTPCPTGLACLGEFIWPDGQGFCIAGWQAKDFYSFDSAAIPDDGTTISSSIVACGLATVPVDIVVTLHLDHPRPEDLLITLEDPNEQQGTVLDHETYAGGDIVAFVGSGDDSVNGLWTLRVTDTVAGESGALLGWSVYLLSNFD